MARLYGRAIRADGSKIDKSVTISTSWNGNRAYPSNGFYSLDLGGNPRQAVTVYVDGETYGSIHVDGDQPYDIEC